MVRPVITLCIASLTIILSQPQAGRAEELKEKATLQESGTGIPWLAFSEDGKTLAWASITQTTGTVIRWDLAKNEQTDALEEPMKGTARFAFSPDGKWIAVGARPINGVPIQAEAKDLVTEVRLLEMPSCKERFVLKGHGEFGVDHLAISHKSDLLAVVTSGNQSAHKVKLWDVNSGKLRATLQDAQANRVGTGTFYTFAAFLPGDKSLAVVGNRMDHGEQVGLVQIWTVATGNLKDSFIGYPGQLYSTVLSKDGKLLALGGGQVLKGLSQKEKELGKDPPQVILWDVASKKHKQVIKGFTKYVMALAFSPDGKLLATGSRGQIKIWSVVNGKEVAEADVGNDIAVSKLAFSPDGKTLASISQGYCIKLWDVPNAPETKKP